MGIDIPGRKHHPPRKTNTKSPNLYVHLLVKLYAYLASRTDSKFNATVLRRLYLSKSNRPPVSIKKLANEVHERLVEEGKILVVVSTVTDDSKFHELPKMTVAALRCTPAAKSRIEKAGGEVLTLDQLALRSPTGENTLLLEGDREARKSYRYFGFGPHSGKKQHVRSKGRKFEKARGARKSRGFKVT